MGKKGKRAGKTGDGKPKHRAVARTLFGDPVMGVAVDPEAAMIPFGNPSMAVVVDREAATTPFGDPAAVVI